MSLYHARTLWARQPGEAFTDNRYRRAHRLIFDGLEVAGSSSPAVVPLPYSEAAALDPEEGFVAALSSCHMLWFLALAAKAGFRVDAYDDRAEGELGRRPDGREAMTRVTLRPVVAFGGERQPSDEEHAALHHAAHERCYIANSVSCELRCEPTRA